MYNIRTFCSILVTYTNWIPGEPSTDEEHYTKRISGEPYADVERCGAQQVRNFITWNAKFLNLLDKNNSTTNSTFCKSKLNLLFHCTPIYMVTCQN